MSTWRRVAPLAVFVLICCTLVAVVSPGHNPLAGRSLYVETGGSVGAALAEHPEDAARLATIAGAPQARWFDGTDDDTRAEVDRYVSAATAAEATPMLVLYAIPERDCGGHSAGGLADAASYRDFVAQVRAGVAGRRALVIIEPDALTSIDCLPAGRRDERIELLRETVGDFGDDPTTVAYLDAGHSRWLGADHLAELLREIGIARIRGVSLNVSNFFTTEEERAYGEKLGVATGSHYVIDSSRNGLGPGPDYEDNWCNPSGRALGHRPQVATGPLRGYLDAYLWVKRPGESDGACHPGDPASGVWFNAYALELISNAEPGTRA